MDIEWDLLHKYLAGDCTAAERERFEAWLADAPMHRQIFHEIQELAIDADRMVPAERQAALLADLKQRVAGTAPLRLLPKTASRHRVHRALRIAAMLVGILGASAIGYQYLRESPVASRTMSSSARTFTTPRAARLSVRLPDGTLAELAPSTTLRVLDGYGARVREVELEGEAVFTVTHDASRPFAVHTNRLIARDLGTRFVVREYSDDTMSDVVVAEGIVAVSRSASTAARGSDSVLLRVGDRARITDGGSLAVARGVSLDGYFGWTQGKLVFRGVRLDEAVAQLERWYDIDIQLMSMELGALQFTATFEATETATDVVRVIADALNLHVVGDGRRYTLDAK